MFHVILSGGIDSATALASVMTSSRDVATLSFDYGQRHAREIHHAVEMAEFYGVQNKIITLDGLLSGSALLNGDSIPDGPYEADSMAQTVVNGRNLLFAAVAVAQAQPGDVIVTGAHAGDHDIYPDCRPQFWQAVDAAAQAYGVSATAPYINQTKAEVIIDAAYLNVPLHLTWSCYRGHALHCGRCGTCVERAQAFDLAGVTDPTEYADPDYWRRVAVE